MNQMTSRRALSGLFKPETEPVEFHVDGTFNVTGVGVVAAGLLRSGTVKLNQTLLLGPDKIGQFRPVLVRSIHYRRTPADEVRSGQAASFALRSLLKKEPLKKNAFRKGAVLLCPSLQPKVTG